MAAIPGWPTHTVTGLYALLEQWLHHYTSHLDRGYSFETEKTCSGHDGSPCVSLYGERSFAFGG